MLQEFHAIALARSYMLEGGVEYGLGWMLRQRGGRRVVEHGGNIDGFSAEVALMPDARLCTIPSAWGHRAGNPVLNPTDRAFIGAQVRPWLEDEAAAG